MAVINIGDGVTVISTANIESTSGAASAAVTIQIATGGTLNIDGGLVRSINHAGRAIVNNGELNISDGTVSAVAGVAIVSTGTGTVTISGGKVSATSVAGAAIVSEGTGLITISGDAEVTSINTTTTQGTIHLSSGAGATERLRIEGGKVENMVDNQSAKAIRNNTNGGITITGGEVTTSANGNAIRNDGSGDITISGGTVSATTGAAIRNESTGEVNISGGTVLSSLSSGRAIVSNGLGPIYISQAAGNETKITSLNTAASTIHLTGGGNLSISGGEVTNSASGNAIYNQNNSNGSITISGGTVQAGTGRAILSDSLGAISISQDTDTTLITSENRLSAQGTIHLSGGGGLLIEGGEVKNTSNIADSKAIHNTTAGTVTITGGTVESTRPADAYAVYSAVETAALSIDFDNADIIGQVHPDSEFTVASTAGWEAVLTSISTGGDNREYTIEVTGDISIEGSSGNTDLTFGNATDIEVTITGSGTLTVDSDATRVLLVGANQTLIVGETGSPGPTLQFINNSAAGNNTVVHVRDGGIFELRGETITGGNCSTGTFLGGGVYV